MDTSRPSVVMHFLLSGILVPKDALRFVVTLAVTDPFGRWTKALRLLETMRLGLIALMSNCALRFNSAAVLDDVDGRRARLPTLSGICH